MKMSFEIFMHFYDWVIVKLFMLVIFSKKFIIWTFSEAKNISQNRKSVKNQKVNKKWEIRPMKNLKVLKF